MGESNQEFRLRNVNNFENDQVTPKVRNFANGDVVDNEVKLIQYVHDETPKKNDIPMIFSREKQETVGFYRRYAVLQIIQMMVYSLY